jgi:hypothetical protein
MQAKHCGFDVVIYVARLESHYAPVIIMPTIEPFTLDMLV